MKVTTIQMKMVFSDPEYNYDYVRTLIKDAILDKPDVITLPEMWNVGFYPKDLSGLADVNGDKTKLFIGNLAKEYQVNIVAGSVATAKNDKFYNTSYIFNREGVCIAEYDKIHTFSYMNEDVYFESGNKSVTFELDEIKCGVIICYDLRFLELVRTLALKNIDVLFVVAQWPIARIMHWNYLNVVRAIENQIFVCCNNAVGIVDGLQYGGHSKVISPWGDILARADHTEEKIFSVDLDFKILKEIRNTIHIFKDRKPQLYHCQ